MILKPSERDPTVPIILAELMTEAGLPDGLLQVVNGDKEAVDAILDSETVQAVGFVGSTPIAQYIYARATAAGKRAQCFGGAKNHMIIMPDADMDQAADALIGAGYGAAGERCMAISVAVPVGDATADALIEKLVPRIERLKVGPTRPVRTWITAPSLRPPPRPTLNVWCRAALTRAPSWWSTGAGFRCRGMRTVFRRPASFDRVTKDMDIYKTEIFGPVLSSVRAQSYEEALGLAMDHEYGNGTAIFTRDGDTARDFCP